MSRPSSERVIVLLAAVLITFGVVPEVAAQAPPTGEVVMAYHVTIAPSWFELSGHR